MDAVPAAIIVNAHRKNADSVAAAFASQVRLVASYNEGATANFESVLKAAYPRPQVLIIGGCQSDPVAAEVSSTFASFWDGVKASEPEQLGKKHGVARVPVGTFEREGIEKVVEVIRDELGKLLLE